MCPLNNDIWNLSYSFQIKQWFIFLIFSIDHIRWPRDVFKTLKLCTNNWYLLSILQIKRSWIGCGIFKSLWHTVANSWVPTMEQWPECDATNKNADQPCLLCWSPSRALSFYCCLGLFLFSWIVQISKYIIQHARPYCLWMISFYHKKDEISFY